MNLPFRNRTEAGWALADELKARRYDRPVVLALPRGGVPVGFEVARALNAPLDVFLVRKLGVPGQEELAFGAIASGGVRVLNDSLVRALGLSHEEMDRVSEQEMQELERREGAYRGTRPPEPVRGRTAILVDDGLATGASMLAAVRALRKEGPERVVVAVPVAAKQACESLGRSADEVICTATPEPFFAVGVWYEDFAQTTDEEVRLLLAEASRREAA